MKKTIYLLLLSTLAVMGNNVLLSSEAFQERVILNDKGEEQLVFAPVAKIVPGNIVIYRNNISNNGNQQASDLIITNDIPKHMEYQDESANCVNFQGCRILFSIDGGATFKDRDQLYINANTNQRILAEAKEITTIKWILTRLEAGGVTQVQFKARLK